jgi:hypothetical protein
VTLPVVLAFVVSLKVLTTSEYAEGGIRSPIRPSKRRYKSFEDLATMPIIAAMAIRAGKTAEKNEYAS